MSEARVTVYGIADVWRMDAKDTLRELARLGIPVHLSRVAREGGLDDRVGTVLVADLETTGIWPAER